MGKMLDEFDATVELDALTADAGRVVRAVTLGTGGRTVHTAATRMDARNCLRFQNDRQALEQWVSARTVLGSPQATSKDGETPGTLPGPVEGGTPGAGGDVRPAA